MPGVRILATDEVCLVCSVALNRDRVQSLHGFLIAVAQSVALLTVMVLTALVPSVSVLIAVPQSVMVRMEALRSWMEVRNCRDARALVALQFEAHCVALRYVEAPRSFVAGLRCVVAFLYVGAERFAVEARTLELKSHYAALVVTARRVHVHASVLSQTLLRVYRCVLAAKRRCQDSPEWLRVFAQNCRRRFHVMARSNSHRY